MNPFPNHHYLLLKQIDKLDRLIAALEGHDHKPTQREKVAAMTIDGITPTKIAWILGTDKSAVMYQLERIAAEGPPDIGITGVPV